LPVVGIGKSQVQLARSIFGAICPAHAVQSRAKPAPKPGKIPAGDLQPPDPVRGTSRRRRRGSKLLVRRMIQMAFGNARCRL
jgi:hypothetical protein